MEGIERGWGSGGRKKRRGLGKRGEGSLPKNPLLFICRQFLIFLFPFSLSPCPLPPLFAPATLAVINWEAGSYFFTCLQITQVKRLNYAIVLKQIKHRWLSVVIKFPLTLAPVMIYPYISTNAHFPKAFNSLALWESLLSKALDNQIRLTLDQNRSVPVQKRLRRCFNKI